jgi:hypothetical protein
MQPHVLVIDDERQILRALRTVLTAPVSRTAVRRVSLSGYFCARCIIWTLTPDMDVASVRLAQWTQTPVSFCL